MKYKVLYKFLQLLIGIKRLIWWSGSFFIDILAIFFQSIWQFFAFFKYKIEYLLRRIGWGTDQLWWLRRDNLQIILLLILLISALPQTKVIGKEVNVHTGHKTMAYKLFGPGEQYVFEEVYAEGVTSPQSENVQTWRSGAVQSSDIGLSQNVSDESSIHELGTITLAGRAIVKPAIMPGVAVVGTSRKNITDYTILPGDSLSSIAYRYNVSVATLMWENNLGTNSIIRPGDKIRIPPVSGVMHTIVKGDNLKKIANTYKVEVDKIVAFNNLNEDGTDLIIGAKIMVPDGEKIVSSPVQRTYVTTQSGYAVNVPSASSQSATTKGFVWPTAAKTITQYYGWRHYGLDVAGPMGTAIYAAKAGTVVTSQCGWNSGYGCYIIIDHGGGVRTLYGHNSKLLVSVGDQVSTGQTISLMGNTGKVYGVTGIHLHFEIRINGATVNPLSYVR